MITDKYLGLVIYIKPKMLDFWLISRFLVDFLIFCHLSSSTSLRFIDLFNFLTSFHDYKQLSQKNSMTTWPSKQTQGACSSSFSLTFSLMSEPHYLRLHHCHSYSHQWWQRRRRWSTGSGGSLDYGTVFKQFFCST